MNDQEAFAYHFRQLEERGLNGPVPEGWLRHDSYKPTGWCRYIGECASGDEYADPKNPESIDIDALAFAILRELTATTTVTVSPPGRNHPRTVTTPAGSVSEDSLLAAIVKTYWKAQDAPSP